MSRRAGAGTARRAAVVLAAATLLALGCAGRSRLDLVSGDLAGNDIASLVDSKPARRLLADMLARRSLDQRLVALAPSLLGADFVGSAGPAAGLRPLPDQARLRELAQQVSLDFAALAFARALGADERSRAVQAAFDYALREGAGRSEEVLRRPNAFPYTVLFAPAWLYRSHPETGADFVRQRRLLDRLGIPNRLIATPESGSVEDNASTIAAAVREAARDMRDLILVSTSKSGAEVALALSRVLAPEETARVAGWLNAGGALGGTPHADSALRPPTSWLTRSVFWLTGWNRAGVTSMATRPSRQRLEGAQLPDSIAVVNLVAVPLSGTVSLKVYWGYKALRRHGPNDGVVLLADAVWPGGTNLVALGSDHIFAALQEDAHALALLRALDVAIRLHAAPGARGAWPRTHGVPIPFPMP
ncbi:MAG: hypothetical protein ACREJ9_17765 [Candidatus Rokuibacteriota bacterium]